MGVFRSLILAFLLVGLVQGYGRPMIEDGEPAYTIGANTEGETPQNADPLKLNRLIIAAIKSKSEKAVPQSAPDGNEAEERKSTWRVGAIIVAGSRRYPLRDAEDRAGVISSSSKFAAIIGAFSGNEDVKTDVYTAIDGENSTDVSGETSGKYKGIEMTKPLVTGSARSRAYNVIDATESNDIPGLDTDSQHDLDQNSGNIVQKKSARFTVIGNGPTLEQVNGKWRWRPMSNESKSPHKDKESVAMGGFSLKKFNSRPDSDSLRYAPLNSPSKSRLESYLKRRITKLVKENSYIFEKPEWQNTKK